MVSTRSVGSSRGSTSSRNVRRGSSAETTIGAWNSVPSVSATPVARPFAGDDVVDRRLEPDLDAERLRRPGQHLGEAAVAALVERPRPELAVVLAEDVVQQHEPRPLRVRPDLGADDRRRGQVALQDVGLEVVVEEVGGAAGQQPDRVVEDLLVEPLEPAAEVRQGDQLLGVVAPDVRRRLVEQRLDRLQDLVDVVVERVVRVRVVPAVAGDRLLVLGVVLAHQQVVAVLHRAERGRHQDRHEAVLDEVEVLDDVGPQEAERVRERREPEARPELLGDRRAADQVASLEDERPQPGLGQVGAVGQAVVAATDDDRVVGPVGLRLALAARPLLVRLGLLGVLGLLVLRHVRRSFAGG